MTMLAKSNLASQLRTLRLHFPLPSFGKPSRRYESLFSEGRLPRLESLVATFPPDGFIRFVNANKPKQLKTLRLQFFDPTLSFDELIQSSVLLRGLHSLQIPCSNLGNDRVRELVKSPSIRELSSLDLTDNNLDADGLRSLSDSVCLPKLSELHLGLNGLGDEGWKIIGDLKCNRLAKLCLDNSRGGDQGVQYLSRSWTGDTLRALSLQGNAIGPEGTEALAKSRWTDKLSELRLDNNPVGDDGANALAKGDVLPNLVTLSLRHAAIGSRGLSAILDGKNNRLLSVLLLDGANLSDAPFRKLSDASFSSSIRELSLRACDVGNSGIGELCSNEGLPQLRVLRLALNHFDEVAVPSLKNWTTFRQLWEVDLSHNRLSDSALAELGAAGAFYNVAELRMYGTDTSSVGVKNCLRYMPRLKLLVHHELRNWTF
jgi:Ran GTPase-activating protein (RanGAP) involved in mRNA processing and transport